MGVPISNVTRRVVYAASGTGPYAFTFEILANTDIAVYRDDTLLTLTTDYTVTIAANGTGSITLVAAPTGATQIAIVGNRTIQRTTDFVTGGDFFANTINNEMDQQTIFAQQNAEGLARAMQAPQTDPTSIDMTLPRASVRAGKYLSFDNDGNPVAAEGRTEVAAVYAIRDEIAAVSAIDTEVVAVDANSANINTVAGISGNVTTVAGISANVTTVAGNNANVTSVAGNAANINTVAGSIANVNNVGGSIASVNTVAGELGAGQDVTVVAANLSGTDTIGTVAGSIANVDAVGTNISNVNAVNSNATNINTVAGQITPTNNVSAVAAVASSVATVAGISSGVTTVAGISANVTTVAGVSANVTTVAGSIGSVNTVSGSIASVNTNATNIANINQNAANIVAIQNASANATAAAASAATATTQATNAAASAAAASAVALGDEPVRPLIRPSLLLDFANTKQLDPRITFTRASTGTYYDGKTVAKAEENLLLQSQTFQTTWTVASSGTALTITANALNAPDGTTTAEQLTNTATTVLHRLSQPVAAVRVSTQYAISFFAKNNNAGFIAVSLYDDTSFTRNAAASFNLSTGAVGTTSASGTGYSVDSTSITETPAGSGWYRCTAVVTVGSTCTTPSITFAVQTASTLGGNYGLGSAYLGAGESIYLWGAQVEQRSSVTAYTATTTQPITNYVPVLLTAASGVARFEHNPITGESLGLEIEESRTNLLLRSEEFNDAAWVTARSSVSANLIVAPDGTLTADKLVEDTTASNSHYIRQGVGSLATSTAYTVTVYAKAAERGVLAMTSYGAAYSNVVSRVYFDLVGGAVGTVGSGYTASITPVGNGWYRCSATRTTSAAGNADFELVTCAVNGTVVYTGNGFSGIYIWGAQLEAGAFATSYIPTVASQVTRAADAASMTGTNFSSWYRADEGTLYAETVLAISGYSPVIQIDNGTADNRILVEGGVDAHGFVRTNAVTVCSIDMGATSANTNAKFALAYKVNDFAGSLNAGTVGTDTDGILPVVTTARIGANTAQSYTQTIKKIAYYPVRVTNAQLQGLTTV